MLVLYFGVYVSNEGINIYFMCKKKTHFSNIYTVDKKKVRIPSQVTLKDKTSSSETSSSFLKIR